MKAIKCLLLIVLICLNACGCSQNTGRSVSKREVYEYIEKTVKIKQPVDLFLECDSADIEIYSWDRQEVKFEIKKKVRSSGTPRIMETMLDKFNLEVSSQSSEVFFKSEYKDRISGPSDASIDLKVYIPKKIGLFRCVLDVGRLRVLDDIRCEMEARINMANVTINRFDGCLQLKADMCDLRISEGKIWPESNVDIGMGNIFIRGELEKSAGYSFQTGMGNVEFQVPSGSTICFDPSGTVEPGEFTCNSGSPGIKVRSGMGRVSITGYR